MSLSPHIIARVEEAWENRASVTLETQGLVREAVEETLDALDAGEVRVAEKIDGKWVVNQWPRRRCCCPSV